MNTRQLTAVWLGILLLSGGLGWFASEAERFGVLVSLSLGVVLWVAGFVYSFSDHNKADNRRVFYHIGGTVTVVAVTSAAVLFFPEYSEWLKEQTLSSEEETSSAQIGPELAESMERFHELQRRYNERLRLLALSDSFSVTLLRAEAAEYRFSCPSSFQRETDFGDKCLTITARVKNNTNRTLREFTLWAEITDTLGNQVDRGGGRTDIRLAPGEEEEMTVSVNTLPEVGENRELELFVSEPEFVE